MPVYQFDSSGIVKRYVTEVGSDWVNAITDPAAGNSLSLAVVTRAEVASALTRRAREGTITTSESLEALRDFEAHCATEYRLVPTEHSVVDLAVDLIRRYPLRAYDAIQLASALTVHRALITRGLPPPVFVTADASLIAAAVAEGLAVENPNLHP